MIVYSKFARKKGFLWILAYRQAARDRAKAEARAKKKERKERRKAKRKERKEEEIGWLNINYSHRARLSRYCALIG